MLDTSFKIFVGFGLVLNLHSRIILVAEAYDYSLLICAEWLSEKYDVDITCCRVAVAIDPATNSEYLVCSNVYPAPELSKEAVPRGRKRGGSRQLKWADWKDALSGVSNSALVSYFNQELKASRESYLRRRGLRYRHSGKRRWFVTARNVRAYVWQQGRFNGDIEFWQGGLSKPDEAKSVKDGKCLRLHLYTAQDFQFFHDATTKKLQTVEWLGGSPEDEMEEAEEE